MSVSLNLDSGSSYLRGGTDFSVEETVFTITKCQSGYSDVIILRGKYTSFSLYDGDQDCLVSLRSFLFQGRRWTKLGGGDFGGAGSAEFSAGRGSPLASVTNPANLSGPVTGRSAVAFSIRFGDVGKDVFLFKAGPRKEIPSKIGADPAPALGWQTDSHPNIEVNPTADKISIRLRCLGRFTLHDNPARSGCQVSAPSGTISTQYFGEYFFKLIASNPDALRPLRFSVFSFLFHRPHEIRRLDSVNQIWFNRLRLEGGIVLNFPLTDELLKSRLLHVMILHRKRFERMGRWSFTWLPFSFGFEGQFSEPDGVAVPDDYEPDYDAVADVDVTR